MLATSRGALLRLTAAGLAALLVPLPASAGKLADAGRETRTPSSTSSSSSSGDTRSSHGHHSSHCCESRGDGEFAVLILTSPWTGPYYALESPERGAPIYEDHPYARGSNGLLHYRAPHADEGASNESGDAEPDERETPVPVQSIAGQVRAEGGYVLGGVYRGAIGARLMAPGRLELDMNVHAFAEPLASGSFDRASLGNAHVGLRFAQSERVQFHTGLGYQQYADAQGIEPGIDFLYGFDIEPGAHLVLSASGNLGSAGHAFVGQVRGSLGVMVGPVEIFAGYDHISVGGVQLGGPAAGIRAWL